MLITGHNSSAEKATKLELRIVKMRELEKQQKSLSIDDSIGKIN
jgi:hypothetical protein